MATGSKFIVSPDLHLISRSGKYLWTPDRAGTAWELAYAYLNHILRNVGSQVTVHLVCGAQGSGKTTWVEAQHPPLFNTDVYVDATFPTASERRHVLSYAKRFGCPVNCVFFTTPLALCLQRNRRRSPDRRVPAEVIVNTHSNFEAPTTREGFTGVTTVEETHGTVVYVNFKPCAKY